MALTAHLVGSVPLPDAEAVYRTLTGALGTHLTRLPDGETGRRSDWIGFVRRHLGRHPSFEVDPTLPRFQFKQWDGAVVMEWPLLRFKPGIERNAVSLDTGYARTAIDSYAVFARLQDEGVIPPGLRFQVCAATPLAIAMMYIAPADRGDFLALYTRHLADEVAAMAAHIPPDRLAIQWDVCQDVLWWEGYFPRDDDTEQAILNSLAAIGAAVPARVQLGYHLCYGSPLDAPCLIPRDMGVLTAMTNGILSGVRRPIDYIHLPVPQARSDAQFFAPLADLELPTRTHLYLGCVLPDDPAGNRARLDLARAHVPVAGIGAECGLGRGDPARLGAMLDAHKALIEAP